MSAFDAKRTLPTAAQPIRISATKGGIMQFDIDKMAALDRFGLLLGTVVPRPIALVTTLGEDGTLNSAPYSQFTVLSHDPPLLLVSVLSHPDRRLKDTAKNILATKEFTVSLVSEAIAEAMNVTCIDAPPGTSELKLAGLETAASTKIKTPRVAASPVAFECRFLTSLSFGSNQAIFIGQMVYGHVADQFVINAERGLIDTPKLKLIGGMHGQKWYARLSDCFAMDRSTWAEWVRQNKTA
jgi:flavin reductase (DIM6/NTAB) family NADH-FMN oxidoreductase RutF